MAFRRYRARRPGGHGGRFKTGAAVLPREEKAAALATVIEHERSIGDVHRDRQVRHRARVASIGMLTRHVMAPALNRSATRKADAAALGMPT